MSCYKTKVITIIDSAIDFSKKNEQQFLNRAIEIVSVRTGLKPSDCRLEVELAYKASNSCREFKKIFKYLQKLREYAVLSRDEELDQNVNFRKRINSIEKGLTCTK